MKDRERRLAPALLWIKERGDLLGFACDDSAVVPLFRLMRDSGLIVQKKNGYSYMLTEYGERVIGAYLRTGQAGGVG
jgi:hypothetical protein